MSQLIDAPVSPAVTPLKGTNTSNGNPTILIVDDSPLCRGMVARGLQTQGFNTLAAGNGETALTMLAENDVQLILLDNDMPVMNGLVFLKALRALQRFIALPVIMLTTTSSRDVIAQAMQFKISGYLLKEKFSVPDLLGRVRNAIVRDFLENLAVPSISVPSALPAPSSPGASSAQKPAPALSSKTSTVQSHSNFSVPNLVPAAVTLAAIADLDASRTLSGVVEQIAAAAASTTASVAELAGIVRQDPILAARVLRLAASPIYAGSKIRLGGVEDAVRIVGLAAVRDLAATVGVFDAFSEDGADGVDMVRCWQHALAVATVVSRIVPRTDALPSGLSYLMGLCHDITEILLRQKFPQQFGAAIDYANQARVSLKSVLPSVFGVPYVDLSRALFDKIALPRICAEPILDFEQFAASAFNAHKAILPRALAIADSMAHAMLLTNCPYNSVSPISQADCRSILIPTSSVNVVDIRSESITTVSLLANASPMEEVAIGRSIVSRCDKQILYIRHAKMAQLDPLEAALHSLAKVETRDRLPKIDELGAISAIVMAAPARADLPVSDALRLRAQSSRPLPLLNLVASLEEDVARNTLANVTERIYPLTLRDLADWLRSC